MGDIVSAVLDPTNRGDERLREGAGGEAAETLKQIRELLS